jgi:hypothetical protein
VNEETFGAEPQEDNPLSSTAEPQEVNEDGEVIVEAVDETFGAMISMVRDYLAENPLFMAYDPDKTMS